MQITPNFMKKLMFETDCLLLTRFGCGSHSLLMTKGIHIGLTGDVRLCPCGNGLRNIMHCMLTPHFIQKDYANLNDAFQDGNIVVLLNICERESSCEMVLYDFLLNFVRWIYIC